MNLLEKKLKQQKEAREKKKKPHRKQEYTPVEIDTGLDDERGGFENDGEEPMKFKKNKPLPLPPSGKPGSKSPKVTPPVDSAVPKKLPKPHPSPKHKPSGEKGAGSSTLGRSGGAGGFALMQELASKKGKPKKMSAAAPPNKTTSSSTIAASAHAPDPDDLGGGEVSEPLYANTAQAQPQADAPYQNMEFTGPPDAGVSKTKTSPTTTTRSLERSDLSASEIQSQTEYQNINFNKKAPPVSSKKKLKSGVHMNGGTAHSNAPRVLPKPQGPVNNSEGVYQNTDFGGGRF